MFESLQLVVFPLPLGGVRGGLNAPSQPVF